MLSGIDSDDELDKVNEDRYEQVENPEGSDVSSTIDRNTILTSIYHHYKIKDITQSWDCWISNIFQCSIQFNTFTIWNIYFVIYQYSNILFIITLRGDHNEYPIDEISSNSGRSIKNNENWRINTYHR